MVVDKFECKIANSKWLVIEDNIIKEKDLTLQNKKEENLIGIATDIVVFSIFSFISKEIAMLIAVNSVVNRAIRIILK